MDYFDGVHVFGTSSSVGPLDYKELFIRLAFSTTPSSDRYAMHVSVDMTTCPWKFNYGDHHVSSTAPHDSHDAARTHETTRPPTYGSPLLAPLPLCLREHYMWTSHLSGPLKLTHVGPEREM